MAKKELLEPNRVGATLFVGVGGIGCRIIKGVAERCIDDYTNNIRFVTMDTDVNDLSRLEQGQVISTIQTSSTRSIKDYLSYDKDAKNYWFPENKILDYKTVSEGAGQVRAISRLALNATIRQGNINKLYDAIDQLYLKDGSDKQQAVKVVIASSLTGGTGSGIAMLTGMLVRKYLNKNYPESSAIIRGFFIMPGVMDTVIKTESERLSQKRNGYAALKEINAFMMKGSGFFDSEPSLKRYKDMHIKVPTTSGEDEILDNLPFDFCFLLDRIDEKQRSMRTLAQYEDFAAQSIYEQNIGPMNKSASSKEDNIVKEFIDPKKLGRCRFGGAGASVLRYPYQEIRDYIALNWTQRAILGAVAEDVSDDVKAKLIRNSWLRFDAEYRDEVKKFERNPNATASDEPSIKNVYIDAIENVNESGDDFINMLRDKHLSSKIFELSDTDVHPSATFGKKMTAVAAKFIDEIVNEAVTNHVEKMFDAKNSNDDEDGSGSMADCRRLGETPAAEEHLKVRYKNIETLEDINESGMIEEIVKKFCRGAFENVGSIGRSRKDSYTIEAYLSSVNKVMHPNAARYMLYKLVQELTVQLENSAYSKSEYEARLANIKNGVSPDGEIDLSKFKVAFNFQKEVTLESMVNACDDKNKVQAALDMVTGKDPIQECNNLLDEYVRCVVGYYRKVARNVVCASAIPYVERLIKSYEKFFNSFENKVVSIEKAKKYILSGIAFNNGDCVKNLFATKEYMDMLVEQQGAPMGNNSDDKDLFAGIYDAIKDNAIIEERTQYNPLLREARHDIFDEIIVEHYKKMVEQNCDEVIDRDILQAIKLEFDIKCAIDQSKAQTDEERERLIKYNLDVQQIRKYVEKTIESCRNLSSPGISKQDFEESRDVNAIAFGIGIKDGYGIRVSDYLNEKDRSASVSKYELHFFSSLYNIMPTQLSKLHYSKSERIIDTFDTHREGAGDYFLAYQDYMEKIGPDSRLNAVITPHMDKRWNSISVMPEMDLEFQKDLTKHIHQALFYGFVFGIIDRHRPSRYAPETFVYRYKDGRNGYKNFLVSNGTICDELYEVMDALYFDRAAVTSIHKTVNELRKRDVEKSVAYEHTSFAECVNNMRRVNIFNLNVEKDAEELKESKVSIFEIPLMYYNSLPAQKKDLNEIEDMVDAIIEGIDREVSSFCRENDIRPLLAQLTMKHFRLLKKNYIKYPEFLGKNLEISSNDVMQVIVKAIVEMFEDLDVALPDELVLE